MADAVRLLSEIKRAAVDAVEASKPVNVYFGEVKTVKPLTIHVEQKMILNESQLILTRNVTNFLTMAMVNWESEEEADGHFHEASLTGPDGEAVEGRTEAPSKKHTHMVAGQKQIMIQNGLEAGDRVILLRQQEGQKFIVLDRIGGRG